MADQMVILCDKADTVQFKIKRSLAEKSFVLKQCVEMTSSVEIPKIPVDNADNHALGRLVEWLEAHEENEMVMNEEEAKDLNVLDEFDKSWFAKMTQEEHFEIIMLANYLQIPRLLDNACKVVAQMISGKKITEIRKMFDIKNDFTPEEEEQLRRENAWLELDN